MIDQYHLLETIERYKKGLECFGQDPNIVHWQSFAVLLTHGKDPATLHKWLVDEGYLKDGLSSDRESDGKPSLWLTPKAMPYYVNYAGHGNFMYQIAGLDRYQAEQAGWLHISGGQVDIEVGMTDAQRRWIDDHGGWRDAGGIFRIRGGNKEGFHGKSQHGKMLAMDVRPTDDFDRLVKRINRPLNDPMGEAIAPGLKPDYSQIAKSSIDYPVCVDSARA